MPVTRRCFCKTRKCGEQKDAAGQPGVILSLRAWKDHQASDNNAELHDRALKSQAEVLRKQEADIVRAVQAMSMNPPEPVCVPKPQKYSIEFVRKIVENLSDIDNSLADIRTQVLLMGDAQSLASDQVIQDNLQGITYLKGLLVEFDKQLIFTTRGPHRNVSAVKEARKCTKSLYVEVEKLIKDTETTWNGLLLSRNRQREADLANGAKEYDSSE
jgi:hypothetical protein